MLAQVIKEHGDLQVRVFDEDTKRHQPVAGVWEDGTCLYFETEDM